MELYPGAELDTDYAGAFDRFQNIGQPKKDDPTDELRCELKTFESRYNSKGEPVILNVGSRQDIDPPGIKYSCASQSAFVLTRRFDEGGKLQSSQLEIRSLHVKAALKAVVPEYRDLNIRAQSVVISAELRCLFRYRKEIQVYGSTQVTDPIAITHLIFILEYMYETLQKEIASYTLNVEHAMAPLAPNIEFDNLWMVFRLDEFIFIDGHGSFGTAAVFKFCYMRKEGADWHIHARAIDYNGTNFGLVHRLAVIDHYDGHKELKDLSAFPLQYHPRKEEIKAKMVLRGKKFIALHGRHHRMYDGIANVLATKPNLEFHGVWLQSKLVIPCPRFYLYRN